MLNKIKPGGAKAKKGGGGERSGYVAPTSSKFVQPANLDKSVTKIVDYGNNGPGDKTE